MKNPILSICLPVYNQTELVQNLLKKLVSYNSDSIEIIVSDDASTENILAIVNSIGDNRIKYFRNEINQGHDLNIINSFERANSDYCFLLRTRDSICLENLNLIINLLSEKDDISYITSSALDENGKYRIRYNETKLYETRRECIDLNYKLYVHPSGSIYNKRFLDLNHIREFILNNANSKFSFISHSLFRITLAQYGNYYIFEKPLWIYTDTSKAKDVAVNKDKGGHSVYSTELIMLRYIAELKWDIELISNIDSDSQFSCISGVFRNYLYQITWGQKRRNRNKGITRHYQIAPKNVNVVDNTNKMINNTMCALQNSDISSEVQERLTYSIRHIAKRNSTLGRVKYDGACLLDLLHLKSAVDYWRNNERIKL